MREVEFQIALSAELKGVDSKIESICGAEGLQIGMKGTLASLPGSTHWHFKRPRERGTLEITFFPRERRIRAQVQDGRRADWIDDCLERIRQTLEKMLKEPKRGVS